MTRIKVLRAPPEYPESALPAHVHKLARPAALKKATQLAFLRFDKVDLDAAQRFWTDFGLITVSRTPEQLVMRGAGDAPALLMARKAKVARYGGRRSWCRQTPISHGCSATAVRSPCPPMPCPAAPAA